MAKKPESDCSCVIDTHGLHELATASGNLKATLIARLEDGTIGVPSWTWQEFKAERAASRERFEPLRVCPGTSNGITEFSEHEAD